MNAFVEEPLKLVLSNTSLIQVRPVEDQTGTHLVIVHVPWPAPGGGSDVEAPVDDLAFATWEDAEWQ